VEGGAVNDDVRPVVRQRSAHFAGAIDIELVARGGNELVSGAVAQEIATELTGAADEQNSHRSADNGANERSRSDMLGSAIVELEVISKAAASRK